MSIHAEFPPFYGPTERPRRIICTVDKRSRKTYCVYDTGKKDFTSPCTTCAFKDFYSTDNLRYFLYVRWKGALYADLNLREHGILDNQIIKS